MSDHKFYAFPFIGALVSDVHTWPTWARRTYLLTFPLSFLIQFAMVIIALIVLAVIMAVINMGIAFVAIWNGKKPKRIQDGGP